MKFANLILKASDLTLSATGVLHQLGIYLLGAGSRRLCGLASRPVVCTYWGDRHHFDLDLPQKGMCMCGEKGLVQSGISVVPINIRAEK